VPPEIEGIIGMQSHTCRQLLGGKSRLGRDCLSAQVEDLQFTWTLRIRLPQELPALCDTESLHFAAPKGIIGLGFQPGKSRKFNQIELVTKPDDYFGSLGPGKVSQRDS
jgi:hypothetical protein